jgi:dipeptidase D
MARSSDDSALTSVREKIEMIASSTGYSLVDGNESPGWLAEPDSRLLKITTEEYESYLRTFNPTQEISIKAVHAGLECGAFKRINKDLQMVSIGPDIRGAHTPEQFVSVRSVARLYDVVKRVLSRLAC